jgi:DNA-binding GntR family transcriptional regulator
VRSLTPEQVRKIYDVREMLQRQAALLIPLPAPREFVLRLQEIHERCVRAVDEARYRDVFELNDAFHLTLFSGCDNPYLVESIKSYMFLGLLVRAKTMADPMAALPTRRPSCPNRRRTAVRIFPSPRPYRSS